MFHFFHPVQLWIASSGDLIHKVCGKMKE